MLRKICHQWAIGTKDIEMFARVVGDQNPVHIDA